MVVNDIAVPRVVCAVHPSVPAKNATELFAWAKANPHKLTMGSWGVGTQSQAAQVVFDKVYGTKTVSVNYRGESHAVGDLLGGQILMSCATTQTLKGHIEKGALRPIATLGETRAAALPDVPTFAEAGYKDEVLNFTAPIALVAPAGVPKAIINRIGIEVAKIVQSEEMQKQITGIGFEPVGNTPDEALAAYNARLPILLRSVRDIGVTID